MLRERSSLRPSEDAASVRHARWAVATLFCVNGAMWSSVVPRLPEIKAAIGLDDALYGAGVAAFSFGALVAGIAAGALVARFGSARLAVATASSSGLVLLAPGLAAVWIVFAAAVLVLGALDATMDVAMNAHGLRVQRAVGRSILHAMHGCWSIGAIIGGTTGAAAAALRVPVPLHLLAAGIVLALVAAGAGKFLLPGAEPAAVLPAGGADHQALPVLVRAVLLLGGVVIFAAIVEDSPGSWSSVLLHEDLGVPPGAAGAAYIACMLAMTVARLRMDPLIDRFGAVRVVRAGAVVAGTALGVALFIDQPWAIVVGFAGIGLGAAPAYPAAFQAAEHLPRVSPGAGVAAVSLVGRFGFLIAPLAIGAIAEASSLRAALVVTVIAAFVVAGGAAVFRTSRSSAVP